MNVLPHFRRVLPLFLGLSLLSALQAQPYEHALGIRAGYSSGITYKGFFLHSMRAIEADVYYNNHGLHLAAFHEWHVEPFRSSKWLIHLGPGVFGGQWDEEFSIGLVGVAGMAYMIRQVPLNIGVEWRPMLNLYKEFAPDYLDFGLTIRYRFTL
jgi:hypothetical protein